MDPRLVDVLNKQLLALERDRGSDGIAIFFLRALQATLAGYRGERTTAALLREMLRIYEALLACRPRMANVIYDAHRAILFLHSRGDSSWAEFSALLETLVEEKRRYRDAIVAVVAGLMREKSPVLLHAHSETVREAVELLASDRKKPRVIVAAQEAGRTDRLIRILQADGFEFSVVSEYSVAHVLHEARCAIFPALSLTLEELAVMAPGSTALISQLRDAGTPVYTIISSNKFNYWSEDSESAYSEVRQKTLDEIEYQKHVYSHDPTALDMFSAVITERGALTPSDTRVFFEQKAREFQAEEAVIGRLLNQASAA